MIYLDNAATTKPRSEAAAAMMKTVECFGNPSSLHGLGLEAEKIISSARETIAGMIGGDKKHLYFTSGGTEANNMAVFGTALSRRRAGNRVITSAIEHPSVLEAFGRLKEYGYEVVYAPADSSGRVDIESYKRLITPDTILVSIMHVNNETGVIQPVEELAEIAHRLSPGCVFHTDCVQSFGKLPVNVRRMGVDMVTVSAHKIHGFKGCGALYTGGTKITPIICGGEQQNGIRPGTENIGGIAAFGAAAALCGCNPDNMRAKRMLMKELLLENVPDIVINGCDEYNSGSVLNVSFLGIKAEILLHSLERHGIYVSTGSACSSHKPQPSHVLKAMGLSGKAVEGAVRFSFSEFTAEDELHEACVKIAQETALIRRYMR